MSYRTSFPSEYDEEGRVGGRKVKMKGEEGGRAGRRIKREEKWEEEVE